MSVHAPFDVAAIQDDLARQGIESIATPTAASDKKTFLLRPDLGRRLSATAREILARQRSTRPEVDLAIIVSDGLSATAIHNSAVPLLTALWPMLSAEHWTLASVCAAPLGRVALQDEVGQLLGARLALTLIGERPGLAAADSLGAYLVYEPQVGKTDADRNCVSNIRPGGLSYDAAANKLHQLLTRARRNRLSGCRLTDQRLLP